MAPADHAPRRSRRSLVAGVLVLWVVVSVNSDRPVTYDEHRGAFQVRIDRQRAGRIAPVADRRRPAAVLGLHGAAVGLPRQAAWRIRDVSASSWSRAQDCRLASRAAAGSASTTSASTAPSATPAPCATRPAGRRAGGPRHAGAAARPAGVRPVRARLHARQPAHRRCGRADACRRSGGPSLFERALLRTGLIDRLKLQTLELRNRIAPILGDGRAALGPRPGGHVQSVQGDSVQLGSDPAAAGRTRSAHPTFRRSGIRSRAKGMHLHWDGDNDSVDERNLSAALGAGVTPVTVDHARI